MSNTRSYHHATFYSFYKKLYDQPPAHSDNFSCTFYPFGTHNPLAIPSDRQALGTWNHFFYSFSGNSAFTALFCPVNESVWEHLKLLFFPFLFVSALEYTCYRRSPLRFFYSRYIGVVSGMIFTVAFFYTYSGIIGRNFLLIDILLFFSSVLIAFVSANHFYLQNRSMRASDRTYIITLWAVTALFFFVFTCFPPDIPLFYSP